MRSPRPAFFFPLLPVLVLSAACGGAASPGPASPAAGSSAPASAPPPSGAPGAGGAATFGDESFKGPMKSYAPTTMVADLKALGLDPGALPPMDQLPPETLRKVMKTFTKTLGARCDDCHVARDFAAPTPRKAITLGMWNHLVRDLSAKDGGPVYCDSCHQGALTPLLDRHNDRALGLWMDANYVTPLKRRDGKSHDCSTCHSDPFEGHFMKTWASAPTSK
ncbi:MAG: hypothetical protein ACLQVI_33245 [Polyangiaceae bacterium]